MSCLLFVRSGELNYYPNISFICKQSEIQCWQKHNQLEVLHKLNLQHVNGKNDRYNKRMMIKDVEDGKRSVIEKERHEDEIPNIPMETLVWHSQTTRYWDMDEEECAFHSALAINIIVDYKTHIAFYPHKILLNAFRFKFGSTSVNHPRATKNRWKNCAIVKVTKDRKYSEST